MPIVILAVAITAAAWSGATYYGPYGESHGALGTVNTWVGLVSAVGSLIWAALCLSERSWWRAFACALLVPASLAVMFDAAISTVGT